MQWCRVLSTQTGYFFDASEQCGAFAGLYRFSSIAKIILMYYKN